MSGLLTPNLGSDVLVSTPLNAHALGRLMGAVSLIHQSASSTMWDTARDACKRVDPDRTLRVWEAFTYGWNLAVDHFIHGVEMPEIEESTGTLVRSRT